MFIGLSKSERPRRKYPQIPPNTPQIPPGDHRKYPANTPSRKHLWFLIVVSRSCLLHRSVRLCRPALPLSSAMPPKGRRLAAPGAKAKARAVAKSKARALAKRTRRHNLRMTDGPPLQRRLALMPHRCSSQFGHSEGHVHARRVQNMSPSRRCRVACEESECAASRRSEQGSRVHIGYAVARDRISFPTFLRALSFSV